MKSLIRKRPSPGLIVAIVALVVALGGSAYANHKINGKDLAIRTLPGKALKKKQVGSLEITRKALQAKHMNDFFLSTIKLSCPGNTTAFSGACLENANRSPAPFVTASRTCRDAGGRLPSPSELVAAAGFGGITIDSGYELSSTAYVDQPTATQTVTAVNNAPVLLDVAYSDATRRFRCVLPMNNNPR